MNPEYIISKLLKKARLKSVINSDVNKAAHIASGCHIVNSKVGRYSDIGYDCQLINTEMGSFCSLASGIIVGGEEHTISWVSTSQLFNGNKDSIKKKFSRHPFENSKRTFIGNDVWIGNHVLVKAGVKVGSGAIIGMGSVVTKDIPDYEIWAGNPAKMIRKRFDEEIIKRLLEIEWWAWDDPMITKYADYFENPERLIEEVMNSGEQLR